MNNLKILVYFSGDMDEPKGTPIRVKNVLNQLIKNGADVFYCGPKLPKNFPNERFLHMGNRYSRAFNISNFANKNKIDVIYIQTSAGLWLAPILQVLSKSKISLDYHSLLVEEEKIYKNLNFFSYNIRKYTDYFLSYFLDFATGVSYKLGDYYKNVIKKYHVLPGGVDISIFNENVHPNKELLDWKGKSILIGYAGNTKWYQGLDTVLSTLVKLQNNKPGEFKLFIVASSLEESISNFIKDNNLEPVIKLLGKQNHDDMPSLLMSADILTVVRPSDMVTEYAFPSKFPEYLALGKTVVFSRVGDIEKYIIDGISGALVNPGSVDALYDRLLELCDLEKRNIIRVGALRLVEEVLDIDKIGRNLYNFINKNAR